MLKMKRNTIDFFIGLIVAFASVATIVELYRWQENLVYAMTIAMTMYSSFFQVITMIGMLTTMSVRVYHNVRVYADARLEYLRLYNEAILNINERVSHNM